MPVSVHANAEHWNRYTGSVTSSAVCESSGPRTKITVACLECSRRQDHRIHLKENANPDAACCHIHAEIKADVYAQMLSHAERVV